MISVSCFEVGFCKSDVCFRGVVVVPCDGGLINDCIYLHTHTHTHTHIYIYIYIYKTKRKTKQNENTRRRRKMFNLKKNRATAAETYNYRSLVYLVQCCFLG